MAYAEISAALAAAFKSIDLDITPVLSLPAMGRGADLQCNSLMPIVGKLPPSEAAVVVAQVGAALNLPAEVGIISPSGRAFLNVTLSDAYLAKIANEMIGDPTLGVIPDATGVAVLDFGGPNVAKQLHVGHLRSFVIGESLRRLLLSKGHKVISDIHLGDWGLQMGKLLLGLEASGYSLDASGLDRIKKADFKLSDLQAFYVIGNDLCPAKDEDDDSDSNQASLTARARHLTSLLQGGHPEITDIWSILRSVSLSEIGELAKTLGAHFDLWLGESDSHSDVLAMVETLTGAGSMIHDAGALIVPLENQKPLLIRSQAGSVLYGATDLATAWARYRDLKADYHVYCVDKRQSMHLSQVEQAAHSTGLVLEGVFRHAAFGTVNGSDGKAIKTREGKPPALTDLIDTVTRKTREKMGPGVDDAVVEMVAIGALKFADLISDRTSDYLFDVEKMTSQEGKSGPYLQYAVVRIKSLLDRANAVPGTIEPPTDPASRHLLFELSRFSIVVDRAYLELKPHFVAEYAFQLAQAFSTYYAAVQIIGSKSEASELGLCLLTMKVLERCLYLMGINVPERM
ncbi:arginine--tRNA ligase [Rhizobium sp. MHM7A]|uniref:arginine--tRNA ligase n=1 Tax=Rhizobium sp. MHM7A TaxID=2583233 RepID=UPI0014862F7F|nr:arginine--tRNA ligase [Rhizobium sp. MHM7A]